MLLRDFDDASRYFDIDSKDLIYSETNPKIHGWFKTINNSLSALLVLNHKLYFIWENERFEINDDYKVRIESTNFPCSKLFILFSGIREYVSFVYSVGISSQDLNISPFWYHEEEDFNWGKFISGIVNDKNRRRNFICNLMSTGSTSSG